MENEFDPPRSQACRKAAGRIADDLRDDDLSQQQKEKKAAIHMRNALAGHIKRWELAGILAVIRGEAGIETIAGGYTDGIDVCKILKNVETKPHLSLQERISLFLDGVAREMSYGMSSMIAENNIPYSQKPQVKALIDPRNPAFQKELAELGQKLADFPDAPISAKPVGAKMQSDEEVLDFSILSGSFSLEHKPFTE